jgi:hypothetical protein
VLILSASGLLLLELLAHAGEVVLLLVEVGTLT